MSRFSQAISEGDGISLVPVLTGDVESLARAAEESGAEAVAVESVADVERVRGVAWLPVLLRRRVRGPGDLSEARAAGADAVVLGFRDHGEDDGVLEDLHAEAVELGFDCAIDVCDDEELAHALARVDPDIVAISDRSGDHPEAFERTLDVLPDVPAGKLVISESRRILREQVVALERAGVDAILVAEVGSGDFARSLADLVDGPD